jgi:hypothetical protein
MTDFDQFWQAYPKKRSKGDARRAWQKLQPSPALVQQILTALGWQVLQPQWTKDGGQFIPHPATWLRGERWDDEPMVDARQQAIAAANDYHAHRQARIDGQTRH